MNPQIAPVLDEIKEVLKKHDMVGLITVGNSTHTDFLIHVDATWSCARIEKSDEQGYFIRIRSKRDEYPTPEAQKESLDKTVGTFVTWHDLLPVLHQQVEKVLIMCAQHMQIDGKSTREE